MWGWMRFRWVGCSNSFEGRGRVSARQPRYFLLLRQKTSTQRKGDPMVRVPALRSGQTCVTHFRLRCGKTHCALWRSVQTRCRKSDGEALALCGANARSLNRVPQAQPDGWERTAGETCDEIGLQRPPKLRKQLSILKEAIWYCPLCPRLRRRPLVARGCTAECRRIVL